MIEINKIEWKVAYDSTLDDNKYGTTFINQCKIAINPLIDKQHIKRTITHEIIHAWLYSYGFYYKDSFTVEEVCEFIGHNLDEISKLTEQALKEIENEMPL